MLKKVMITTDGSDASLIAARSGVELSRLSQAEVIAIYVADTIMVDRFSDYLIFPGARSKIRELMVAQGCKAVGLVEEMAEEARLNVEKVVAEGDPSGEIIRLSSEKEVDVLVIASSGKGGMEKLFMGSVAEKVIRGSKVPVMMVPTNRDHRP